MNDSEQAVASVVEHTTHLDFFKITVSQGIVIDPRHPDAATVFAFVLDPNQADRFHDQLKVALPGLVEQKPLDPAIATRLRKSARCNRFRQLRSPRSRFLANPSPFATKSGNTSESDIRSRNVTARVRR